MSYIVLRRPKLGKTSVGAIEKFSKAGLRGVLYTKQQIPADTKVVFRWGCTANVPKGVKIYNKAEAIHVASDKAGYRKLLQDNEVPCPKTWFHFNEWNAAGRTLPIIIRPVHHHQGRQLYFCNTTEEVVRTVNKLGRYYMSAFIDKVAEYRVFVANGRAFTVAKKTPADPKAVAWNVAQGGHFDNVRFDEWPLKAVKVAIEGFKLSGLDFGGVDIMVDNKGEVYILELNSAPSLTSPYRQECMTKVLDYMVENGNKEIPLVRERGDWKKFVHPAISDRARIA